MLNLLSVSCDILNIFQDDISVIKKTHLSVAQMADVIGFRCVVKRKDGHLVIVCQDCVNNKVEFDICT